MPRVGVIGAGPAGLTAAWELSAAGVPVTVLEADPAYVGGISRTVQYKGFCFDIGGHRFFSKSSEIEELWSRMLPDGMLSRPRSSRIYYAGKYFSYPLKPVEALLTLGVAESAACVASYARSRAFPIRDPDNFEDWVTNEFGSRLYRIFFKAYTEKVWGTDCRQISADWAAQRIKGLSLSSAIAGALLPKRNSGKSIKTLIDSFRYPRKGPGMLWEACADQLRGRGVPILMGRRVAGCEQLPRGGYRLIHQGQQGDIDGVDVEHVISTMPLRSLIKCLRPEPSVATRDAAGALRYRDFLIVVLIARDRGTVRDNWIYIQDPGVKVGRVQNFKSWSPEMVPDPAKAAYGCEYFCDENDSLWSSTDGDLIDLAKRELSQLGLVRRADVVDACVVRQRKAYPVYDPGYAERIGRIRTELSQRYPGVHVVGRNGMHKYNNQDHSMMTALLASRNILAGQPRFDVWSVNQDAEYHEEAREDGASRGSAGRSRRGGG